MIAAGYTQPFDIEGFVSRAQTLLDSVQEEHGWMYETRHAGGTAKARINFAVWSEVFTCPECTREVVFVDEAYAGCANQAGEDNRNVARMGLLLAGLPRVLHVRDALPACDIEAIDACVRTLASGMSRFASRAAERGPSVSWIDDEAELHEYCYVVAGCVGDLLTRLFEARIGHEPASVRDRRRALAPRFGVATFRGIDGADLFEKQALDADATEVKLKEDRKSVV